MSPPSANLGSTGARPRSRASQETHPFGADSSTSVFAVTSGKGGVGKSTVAANLAVASAATGARVGLLDADVYGFSIPAILGLAQAGRTPEAEQIDGKIQPLEAHGVQVISMAMFLGGADARETAVSWRGPLLHRTLLQFLRDSAFQELDELYVDLPPGTGDIAISLGQLLPEAEVLVVTTPQAAATDVAVRSGLVAQQSGQHILGVIENFSGTVVVDGVEGELFGSGGGANVAAALTAHTGSRVELFGSIPISTALVQSAEVGVPIVASSQDDAAAEALRSIAAQIRRSTTNISS